MNKLDAAGLLNLSVDVVSTLVEKEISFSIDGKDYSADVAIKRLSYDEAVDLTRGKKLDKLLMADLAKMRVLATAYNKDTQEPLFKGLDEVGKAAPAVIDALHRASEEVNDYMGKQQVKHLISTN